LTSELQCAINEADPTTEGPCEALSSAARTSTELEQVLQTLRHDVENTTVADVHLPADHTYLDSSEASTIADLERQNKDLREAKDREVTALSNEVQRLKAAIGQLVGVGAAT